MKSSIVKRSITVGGHKTSFSLEEPFWIELKKIALTRKMTMAKLVSKIDHTREQGNLSSAIRLFVLHHVHYGERQMEEEKTHPYAVSVGRTPAR
jgi:predicted DNA-binding ribbon-helix-helix protein